MLCQIDMKAFLLILISILTAASVSASEIGISPPEISFSLASEEIGCRNISLFLKTSSTLIAADFWSRKNSRDLPEYNINSKDLGISINYPEIATTSNKTKIEMCVSARNKGIYYGALLFKAENSNAGIGTWLTLNITSENKNYPARLTGLSVASSPENKKFAFLFFSSIFFLFILLFLLIKLGKNNF